MRGDLQHSLFSKREKLAMAYLHHHYPVNGKHIDGDIHRAHRETYYATLVSSSNGQDKDIDH